MNIDDRRPIDRRPTTNDRPHMHFPRMWKILNGHISTRQRIIRSTSCLVWF